MEFFEMLRGKKEGWYFSCAVVLTCPHTKISLFYMRALKRFCVQKSIFACGPLKDLHGKMGGRFFVDVVSYGPSGI